MTRHLITLAVAFGLCAVGSTALAGKPCPHDDQLRPEKSRVCKAGAIHVCEDGQWVRLDIKCTAKLHEDGHAGLSVIRGLRGDANPQRDAIVRRLVRQS